MTENSFKHRIGNTPILKLPSLSREYNCNIYAKLEYFNPGFSAKDRPALYMIEDALATGKLAKGGTVVEASSGNTGLGVALLAREFGLNCVIFTKDKISKEKLQALRSTGAEVIISPSLLSASHPDSANSKAKTYAEEHDGAFYCNQYYNQMNPRAHYETTGPEIYAQYPEISHFVAAVATGGTISGVGKHLKEQDDNIRVLAVDAVGSILTKYFHTGELDMSQKGSYTIEGVGKSYIPSALQMEYLDDMVQVDDLQSIAAARNLAEREGILPGYSSGAVLASLAQYGERFEPGDNVLLLFPDHGSRYLSKIYNDIWVEDLKAKQNKERRKISSSL